jgi:hypothetical protein
MNLPDTGEWCQPSEDRWPRPGWCMRWLAGSRAPTPHCDGRAACVVWRSRGAGRAAAMWRGPGRPPPRVGDAGPRGPSRPARGWRGAPALGDGGPRPDSGRPQPGRTAVYPGHSRRPSGAPASLVGCARRQRPGSADRSGRGARSSPGVSFPTSIVAVGRMPSNDPA